MATKKKTSQPWRELRAEKFSAAERAAMDAAFEQELLDMDLRQIREMTGATQVGLAKAAKMTQPEVSRLERNTGTAHLATLRRVVKALGGELEIVASFGDKRVRLRAADDLLGHSVKWRKRDEAVGMLIPPAAKAVAKRKRA